MSRAERVVGTTFPTGVTWRSHPVSPGRRLPQRVAPLRTALHLPLPIMRTSLGLATLLSLASAATLAVPSSSARGAPTRGALRFAVAARAGLHSNFTPLVYWGGFQSKTAMYEPLVRFDDAGRLVGVLLASWTVSEDGRTYRLRLRDGVTGHDGAVLDAAAVRDHLVRWRGNPGNRWLGSTDRFERIDVASPTEIVVTLSSPWCFLEEAAIVNPGHVVAGGAYDHEGTFRRTLGTGPYRLDGDLVTGDLFTLLPYDAWWQGAPGLARVDCVRLPTTLREHPDLVAWVRDGGIDLVADGEGPVVPREALAAAAADRRLKVWEGPGSGSTFLLLNTARGAFADRALRQRVASAVDRTRLVAEGELGHADGTTTLFRGGVAGWPAAHVAAVAPSSPAPAPRVAATLLLGVEPSARLRRHGRLLAEMLARVGVDLKVESVPTREALLERLKAGDWDASLRSTHGTPYDPFVSLQTLFAPNPGRTASSTPPIWDDATLRAAIATALAAPPGAAREAAFVAIERRLADEVPLVPLFVSRRVAVSAAGVEGLSIGANGYDVGLGRATSSLPLRPVGPPPGTLPAVAAAAAPAPAGAPAPDAPPVAKDPRDGDVALPAGAGWNASLVLDNGGVGVWTVRSWKVLDPLGCDEIIGLDDKGRCHVLTSYSGKWTPITCLRDGKWLGGVAQADVDPAVPGHELYVGGEKGNLYQIVAHPEGVLDERLVASLPGQAINILLAGDLVPSNPGSEVLAFTWPDGLYVLAPGKGGRFEVRLHDKTVERVRDALVLPAGGDGPPEIVTVSRNGHVSLLRFGPGGAEWSRIHEVGMGMGRVSLRRGPGPVVFYTCTDDGRVLRHERQPDRSFATETIYLGPQGGRGVAAGRFDADPATETVAVFGYAGRVELLSRRPGARWTVATVFHDREKGHWLSAAEVDGRNATDELVCSGFGGRIVLLSRPPGMGLEVLTAPDGR